jgi:glutamyl-tRNA synthetase
MTQPVRTRFAPSPTGFLHVGGVRTALFGWLLARHNQGTFILRIEDTDVARKVEGSVEMIMESLKWLGLDWDEGPDTGGKYGPYVQSQRLEMYKKAIQYLIEQGKAYYCYCSPERLQLMREEQVRLKQPPGYDRLCRSLSDAERAEKEALGIKPVVRFKTPLTGQTRYSDLIWGEMKFENAVLEDLVLLKSDGYPTYNMANVVDDHAMEISHIIRGEEFLSTTPTHVLLYQALGYELPQFAHVPRVLGTDHAKLSKRHGSVSVDEFRKQGYLPEAMINFLALLGWSLDGKTEVMPRQQIIEHFSLERIGKTASIFNKEKLDWMNGVYIRALSPEDFVQKSLPFLENSLPPEFKPLNEDYVSQMLPLVQDRAKLLTEVPDLVRFFFIEETDYSIEGLISKGMTAETTAKALEVSRERLAKLDKFDIETLENLLRPLAGELGLKAGQLFGALRTATTGRTATPPLFQTMAVLGKERCLERIEHAVVKLK